MTLSEKEIRNIRSLLLEIENGLTKVRFKPYVNHRIRTIRLLLVKAERREKGRLL